MSLPPPGWHDRRAEVEARLDGLVEHRRHSLAEGPAPVVETLDRISPAGGPAPLGDLLTQLPQANPEDDTCILAVRLLTGDVIGGA